jgi:hypothetical protein
MITDNNNNGRVYSLESLQDALDQLTAARRDSKIRDLSVDIETSGIIGISSRQSYE